MNKLFAQTVEYGDLFLMRFSFIMMVRVSFL